VCEPLGADAWIGLPAEYDDRCAEIVGGSMKVDAVEFRRAEIPAGNGFTNARALARIYGALACGGDLDGVHLLSRQTLEDATSTWVTGPWFGWTDEVMAGYGVTDSIFKNRFARGFVLNSEITYMGTSPRAFGSSGSGGSFAFADPDAHVSFGYAQNAHIGQGAERHSRSGRLIEALYESLYV
jgi:CubicO group peptidase (beta-lactamase class C family)